MIEKLIKYKDTIPNLMKKISNYKKEIPKRGSFSIISSYFSLIGLCFGLPIWFTLGFGYDWISSFFDKQDSIFLSSLSAFVLTFIFIFSMTEIFRSKEKKLMKNKSSTFFKLKYLFKFNLIEYKYNVFEKKVDDFIDTLSEDEMACLNELNAQDLYLDNLNLNVLKDYLLNKENKKIVLENKSFFSDILKGQKKLIKKEFEEASSDDKKEVSTRLNLVNDLIISLNDIKNDKEDLKNVILSKDKKVAINKI